MAENPQEAAPGRGPSWLGVSSLGLGNFRFHISLWTCLASLSAMFAAASIMQPHLRELRSVAISLPLIWLISLTIRVAAQRLAVGKLGSESAWLIGPTGNFSLEYESQPRHRILAYASAGQIAGVCLLAFGWIVSLAYAPEQGLSWWTVDFRGGWTTLALATQLFWVNAFLVGMHFIPTVPFDMRALVWCGLSTVPFSGTAEPQTLRKLSLCLTHSAAVFIGAGVVLCWASYTLQLSGPWYALFGAAAYLFVAARWEATRCKEAEELYARPLRVLTSTHAGRRGPGATHLGESRSLKEPTWRDPNLQPEADWIDALFDAKPDGSQASDLEPNTTVSEQELDEILRKLHREGRSALLPAEQEALMLASQRLNKRRTGSS